MQTDPTGFMAQGKEKMQVDKLQRERISKSIGRGEIGLNK